ncbi:MAG TPA: hypothetical protein VH349_19035 [Ktedonobacterales bacterium]
MIFQDEPVPEAMTDTKGFSVSNILTDILIKDHNDEPIVAVEVKNRQNLTPEIATTLRRNLIFHGFVPRTPYFLLLSQDVGYLWKDAALADPLAPPDYQFPLDNVLSRYLKSESPRRLYGSELELVVAQWLIGLTLEQGDPTEEPEITLRSAGLDQAIRGGSVLLETAA